MSGERSRPSQFWTVWLTGRRRLLAIFILALIIRLAYLLEVRNNPSFQILALDSEMFDQWALRIARGDFWGNAVFHSPPLYPYFLALIYAVGGPSLAAVRIIQIALGAMTAMLLTRLSEHLFEEPVPTISGVVAAAYGPFIFYSAAMLSTVVTGFLAALSLVLFYVFTGAGKRAGLLILLAGISLGLTCLGRPNSVLILPLWVICLALMRRKTGWLRPAVLLVLGFVLIIGPVTVRNAVVGGDFVPISYHGGINFWIGNHPGAMGTFDLPPGITGTPEQVNIIDSTRLATEELGRPLRPSEVSAYWFRKGWEFVRDNPGEYLRLLVRKVRMFWNRTEIPVNVSFHFLQRSSVCLRIPFMHFGVIAPLAVLGMILGLRQWQRRLPIYSFAAVHFASAVVFFVTARFRLHILLALIPFACYGGWWLYMSLREKRWRHASLALIVVIPVAVHANLPVEGFNIEQSFARDYYYLASHYHSQGQVAEALTYYDLSIVRNPDFWMSYNGRGACLSDLGRLDEAIAAFRKATELAPTRSEPWTNLGIALADHGRLDEAVLAWEQALRVNRADERARSNLEEARRSLRGEEEARLPKD